MHFLVRQQITCTNSHNHSPLEHTLFTGTNFLSTIQLKYRHKFVIIFVTVVANFTESTCQLADGCIHRGKKAMFIRNV